MNPCFDWARLRFPRSHRVRVLERGQGAWPHCMSHCRSPWGWGWCGQERCCPRATREHLAAGTQQKVAASGCSEWHPPNCGTVYSAGWIIRWTTRLSLIRPCRLLQFRAQGVIIILCTIQWNLLIWTCLGPSILSFVERLSSFGGSLCIEGMSTSGLSLVRRLVLFWTCQGLTSCGWRCDRIILPRSSKVGLQLGSICQHFFIREYLMRRGGVHTTVRYWDQGNLNVMCLQQGTAYY